MKWKTAHPGPIRIKWDGKHFQINFCKNPLVLRGDFDFILWYHKRMTEGEKRSPESEDGGMSRFQARIERALTYDLIEPQKRSASEVRDAHGKTIATSVQTHGWKWRVQNYFQQNTFEEQGYIGNKPLWLVIDFDDVLNRTTEYQGHLAEAFESMGLPRKEFDRLYAESKKPGRSGKPVLNFTEFLDAVKRVLPDRTAEIDRMMQGIDYESFLDQGMRRALEVIRAEMNPVKITILTYGDMEYQQMRVDASGADRLADEIIYTEGSKREVIEAVRAKRMHKEYPRSEEYVFERDAFTLTLDDSPEHISDYDKLSPEVKQYANVRFRHPGAKRFHAPVDEEGRHIDFTEDERSAAALDLYRWCFIAQNLGTEAFAWDVSSPYRDKLPSLRAGTDRERVLKILGDPSAYADLIKKIPYQNTALQERYITSAPELP
jgi:FMN phosphatase YigB (HAD superfamily)